MRTSALAEEVHKGTEMAEKNGCALEIALLVDLSEGTIVMTRLDLQ